MVYRRHTTPILRPFRSLSFPYERSNIIYKYQSLYTLKCNPYLRFPKLQLQAMQKATRGFAPSPPPTPHLRRWGWGYGGMEGKGGQGRNTTPLNHSLRYINFPSCNLELCNITLHYNRWTTWCAGSGHIFHVKTTFIIRLTYFSPAGRRPTFKYMCEEEEKYIYTRWTTRRGKFGVIYLRVPFP